MMMNDEHSEEVALDKLELEQLEPPEQQQHVPLPAPAPSAPAVAAPLAADAAQQQPNARVKSTTRHWRALRNALLSSPATAHPGDSATASAISTAFFSVFSVRNVATRTRSGDDAADAMPSSASDREQTQRPTCRQPEANFEWLEYDVSLGTNGGALATPSSIRVYVHEKRKDTRVTIAELLSHKVNAGVDNTGNVRTWPSEPLLLAYVLRTQVCQRLYEQRCSAVELSAAPLNVCELGSGMAGLASLGLLAHAPVAFNRVEITDGNPLSVQNLQLCVDENTALGVFARTRAASIAAKLLRWDRNATFAASERQQVDLLLASDCLFFEDFHIDLAHTIRELLRPGSGQCLLLQPSRGGSMERFVRVAQDVGLCVDRCDAFDPDVTEQHVTYVRERADYVPDVHLPVLLMVSAPLELKRED